MNFLTWGRNPWGQQVLTHVSWDLLWAALFAGLMFLVAHASYMILSAHRKASDSEVAALEAQHKNLPERIERHSLMARLFHWVQAGAMLTLLFTAFAPKLGYKFDWVDLHWEAGLWLIGAIIFLVARDQFSGINPQYWYFPIGILLIAVVLFLPNGILGGLAQLIASERWKRMTAPLMFWRRAS